MRILRLFNRSPWNPALCSMFSGYHTMGRFPMGRRHLALWRVISLNLLPLPAAISTAWNSGRPREEEESSVAGATEPVMVDEISDDNSGSSDDNVTFRPISCLFCVCFVIFPFSFLASPKHFFPLFATSRFSFPRGKSEGEEGNGMGLLAGGLNSRQVDI